MVASPRGAVSPSGSADPKKPAVLVGRAFVDCVARRDFNGLQTLFADDLRFRALIPRSDPEARSAHDARTIMEGWYRDSDRTELLGSTVEMVVDRLQIAYRVRGRENGAWYVVEQHITASVDDSRLTDVALVCSGFRPIEAPREDADRAVRRARRPRSRGSRAMVAG